MNWKIWLLIFVVLGSILAIVPLNFEKGVEIISIEQNSTAYEQGLRQGEIITSIDNEKITTFEEYKEIINSKFPSDEKIKLTIITKSEEFILFTNKTPELSVANIENTRIKTGLDLSGGARAL